MSASIPVFILLLLIIIVVTVIACVVVRCRLRFSKADFDHRTWDENIYDEVDVEKTESEHCNIKMTGNPAYSDTNYCVIVN